MSTKKQSTRNVRNTRQQPVSRPQGQRRKSRKKKSGQQIRYLAAGLLIGLCTCLLVFSLYKVILILMGYQSGDKEYKDLQKQYVMEEPSFSDSPGEEDGAEEPARARVDLASLKEINSETVGWVEIPDTVISYPMTHTADNSYYLTHTFSKETNKAGSIFIETANHADFEDLHTIIYGHNMKNGSMFAGLKDYKKKGYWEDHPYVYIDLEDGSHCYEIFSCHEAPVSHITYTIGFVPNDTYASFLEELVSSSLYDTGVEVGTDDYVITLSTCTNNGKDRFVVHAKKLY